MPLLKPNIKRLQAKKDTFRLSKALRHEDKEISVAAATALIEIGDGSALGFLAYAAANKEANSDVAIAAIRSIDDPVRIEILRKKVVDPAATAPPKLYELLLEKATGEDRADFVAWGVLHDSKEFQAIAARYSNDDSRTILAVLRKTLSEGDSALIRAHEVIEGVDQSTLRAVPEASRKEIVDELLEILTRTPVIPTVEAVVALVRHLDADVLDLLARQLRSGSIHVNAMETLTSLLLPADEAERLLQEAKRRMEEERTQALDATTAVVDRLLETLEDIRAVLFGGVVTDAGLAPGVASLKELASQLPMAESDHQADAERLLAWPGAKPTSWLVLVSIIQFQIWTHVTRFTWMAALNHVPDWQSAHGGHNCQLCGASSSTYAYGWKIVPGDQLTALVQRGYDPFANGRATSVVNRAMWLGNRPASLAEEDLMRAPANPMWGHGGWDFCEQCTHDAAVFAAMCDLAATALLAPGGMLTLSKEGRAALAFLDEPLPVDVPSLVKKRDVTGLVRRFSTTDDWDERETVIVALQEIHRQVPGNKDVGGALRSSLPNLLELCRAEKSGGSYRDNCISTIESLMESLGTEVDDAAVPVNPQLASGVAVERLRNIFVITSGTGEHVLDSPVVLGFIRDTAGKPYPELPGDVPVDIVARSDAAGRTTSLDAFWDAAGAAMASIRPQQTEKARSNEYRTVIRVIGEDPTSGDNVMVVFLYDEPAR